MCLKAQNKCSFINHLKREWEGSGSRHIPLLSFLVISQATTSMISSGTTSPGKHIKDRTHGFALPGRLPSWGHNPFLTGGAGQSHQPNRLPQCQVSPGQKSQRCGPSGLLFPPHPTRVRVPCAQAPRMHSHRPSGANSPLSYTWSSLCQESCPMALSLHCIP